MTLRRRLTIGATSIVLGCLAIAFVAVYAGTGNAVRDQLDGDLRGDMEAFSRVLTGVGGGSAGVRAAALAFVKVTPYAPNARLLYVRLPGQPVVTNDPDLVAPSRTDPSGLDGGPILRSAEGSREVGLPDGARVRLLVRRVPTGDGTAVVGVGESTRLVERAQAGVLRSFLLAGLLTLVLAGTAAAALGTRLARPLRRMAVVAARIQEGDLGRRMAPSVSSDPGGDVAVLAEAFDLMLDRLQAAFDRQRAFVADASHELRTPLTVIRGQLEVLALNTVPGAEDVRRVDRLVRTEVDRMSRMVEDLLVLARAQDDGFLRVAPLPLPALTADLLEAQRATADRDFRHDDGGVRGVLVADGDRIAQAVRNLLRNATEHTAPGGLVRLWLHEQDGDLLIGVDDDGPGIPATERRHVFGRFHRGPERGPRGTGTGTGLGLAIVQAIAGAHGGEAWAQDAPGGGARVTMRLPGLDATPPTDA